MLTFTLEPIRRIKRTVMEDTFGAMGAFMRESLPMMSSKSSDI
jgi:hypothetical protein